MPAAAVVVEPTLSGLAVLVAVETEQKMSPVVAQLLQPQEPPILVAAAVGDMLLQARQAAPVLLF